MLPLISLLCCAALLLPHYNHRCRLGVPLGFLPLPLPMLVPEVVYICLTPAGNLLLTAHDQSCARSSSFSPDQYTYVPVCVFTLVLVHITRLVCG